MASDDEHPERPRRRRHLVPRVLDPVHQIRVMGRFVRRQSKRPGSAPGTLVHTGRQHMERVLIHSMDYDETEVREAEPTDPETFAALRDTDSVTWVNIDGLHDVELVRRVGELFDFHPLVLEDILQVGQRPKVDEHDTYLYMVLPMLSWDAELDQVEQEQLSILLGERYVLTFQERTGDVLDPVRERIRSAGTRIRGRGADYLAYALVDAVVDHYYGILQRMGELTEELELAVLEDPGPEAMKRLHQLKRETLVVRRAVWPVREMANSLIRTESPLITEPTRIFLRDVYDHAVQTIDTIESLRDVVSGTIDLYLSSVSNRMNEVMKVLTIMASIFIPLTFLAGIYGMNFEVMPELALPWAYPALLGFMLVVAGGMVLYFRRKGWL